jgi:hypothetical protein
MDERISRRRIAALLGASPLAAAPPPAAPAAGPEEKAREKIGKSLARMEAFDLPPAAEPAFVFKP